MYEPWLVKIRFNFLDRRALWANWETSYGIFRASTSTDTALAYSSDHYLMVSLEWNCSGISFCSQENDSICSKIDFLDIYELIEPQYGYSRTISYSEDNYLCMCRTHVARAYWSCIFQGNTSNELVLRTHDSKVPQTRFHI